MNASNRTTTGRLALSCIVVLASLAPLHAATFYVSTAGNDANGGTTWAAAKKTVQAGLNAAASGDQVWVRAGTYIGNITLKAGVGLYGGFAGDETDLAQRNWTTNRTILDGNQTGSVVSVPYLATASTRIDGFVIRNGKAKSNPELAGGGIYCKSSSPTIANNTISGNDGLNSGGGIYCSGGSPSIANNTITGNSAFSGGGIYCSGSSPTIVNNTITGNGASGIYCNDSSPTIVNNTITGNAGHIAGIYCTSYATPTIVNNIVAFNASGICIDGTALALRSNCVYGNEAFNYLSPDPTGTDGNISVDPKLAGPTYGNLHIHGNSPCRDAGDDTAAAGLDMESQPRIQDGHVDIGADESDGTAWAAGPYAIIRVSTAGNDANDGSTWALAKRTVQAGLEAAAAAGGEVWVREGVYQELITLRACMHVYGGFAGTETQRSQRNWATHVTALEATFRLVGSLVTVRGGYRISTIDGFTIRNGSGTYGGVYCEYSCPMIANNTITGNTASFDGGGIYCNSNASPTILNCVITGNSANGTSSKGGGICCSLGVSPTIINCTITGNSATSDGGIYCDDGSCATIANTIVAFNSSGIHKTGAGTLSLRSNCVYSNTAYNYSGLADPTGTDGNISANPMLTSQSPWNVHLLSGSPCIDAGDDSAVQSGALDMDAQPRKLAGHVDIGADEFPLLAPAIVVRVSPDGDDANDGSSWPLAKRTVQAGINAAASLCGDVWVKEGLYPERITLPDLAYVYGGFAGTETERSRRDWTAHVTILDGTRSGSVVTIAQGQGINTIDGFVIRNGQAANGGGIYCSVPTTIAHNTITTCSATNGGGIYCKSCSPLIVSNTITASTATNGSGIFCSSASPTIVGNALLGNAASSAGGGIYCVSSSPRIVCNTITANSAVAGGGAFCSSSSPTFTGTLIAFNTSGVFKTGTGTLTLRYTDVYGNTAYNYSGLTDPTGTSGNLSADPHFGRQPTPGPDAVWGTADDDYGDLHLLPGSACLDAGNDADIPTDTPDLNANGDRTEPLPLDLAGQPRFVGTVDIGAYEGARIPGDITGDGHVDVVDLLGLANSWGKGAGDPGFDARCDLNHDGAIDIVDLLCLADSWGA